MNILHKGCLMVFKKGQAAYNKGRKFSEASKEKMRAAQKKRFAEHPELAEKMRAAQKKRFAEHPELIKAISERQKKRVGSLNSNWKGGICFDGLRKGIYSPHHPKPNFLGIYVYEYVLIMEAKLGRYLVKGEIVHHINGDEADNRPENLEVLSQSEHIQRHNKDMQNSAWRANINLAMLNRDAQGRFQEREGHICLRSI